MIESFFVFAELPGMTGMNSEKKKKTGQRYRINIRGGAPSFLGGLISKLHATAILTGVDQGTDDTGPPDESSAAPIPPDVTTGKP